jgi:methyltransferase (TIGR00027 family)
MKAMEAFSPRALRLFDDPVTIDFLPAVMKFALKHRWLRERFAALLDSSSPGVRGMMLCRTRCIDDAVMKALGNGIKSLVILGAGLDSRAYRLPGIAKHSVYEVDLPAVQAHKKECLVRRFGALPPHVRFVAMDFGVDRLDGELEKAGLAAREQTVFIWEGVTQYLQPEAVDAVLQTIAARHRGSELVFTYLLEEVVTGRFGEDRNESFRKSAGRRPEPWHFGVEPSRLASFLSERNLNLCEDVGAEEYLARYLLPLGRELQVSEIERVARAGV